MDLSNTHNQFIRLEIDIIKTRMIPIEVLELCLDELAVHQGHSLTSRKALQACALVSRSLLPRSRHHLYSKIQITWTKDILISKVAHRIQGLRDVLRQNPSIVGHIHALELSIDREGVVTEPFNGLPAIIDMMFSYMLQNKSRRGLQELKLAGGDIPTVWSDLDVTFRQAIFRLMTSPTVNGITQFHLSQLSVFPVTLITHSTLRELTLNHVWFVDDDDWCRLGPLEISVYSYAEYPASKLTKLIANESISRFAIALNSPISSPETLPSSLTTLQAFAVQSRDVAWVRKIITAASETLDSLEIGGIIYGQARYCTISINSSGGVTCDGSDGIWNRPTSWWICDRPRSRPVVRSIHPTTIASGHHDLSILPWKA